MAGTKGNQNAKGHDGRNGGRKSAYEERIAAEMVQDIFAGRIDVTVLKRVLKAIEDKSTKALKNAWEITMFQLWDGKEKTLITLLNKIVPDKIDQKGFNKVLSHLIRMPLKHDTDHGYTIPNTASDADDPVGTTPGETD